MDFESPDVEKEFPGLYASESSRRSDSDYGDSGHERGGKKELLRSKKKDKKDKNKDKGYAALGEDSSPDEMDPADGKNPLKPKKPKSFKFLHKREKDKEDKEKEKDRDDKKEEKKKEKEDKKGDKRKEKEEKKCDKKKEKEKEKEERKREKEEKKKVKKDKKKKIEEEEEEKLPVFGVPLSMAVQRCPSHDGVHLPVIVRECIDYIEEHGLHCEGIYRLSGVKSKVQQLRRQYNCGGPVRLTNQEPHVIASLLKQYLRELPEPVLTTDMMPHFEDVAMIPNPGERAEAMRQLIDRLPTANRLLLQYMFKHMGHIIARERDTKMTYQNVSIVLSPTMQISHRVLNVLFLNHNYLFGNVVIKKYVPPILSGTGDRTLEQLRTVTEIREEVMKQESLLGHLHVQIAAGCVSRKKEESLWEAQRIVTLLKRKLRSAQRREEEEKQRGRSGERRREDGLMECEKESTSEDSQRDMDMEREYASSKEAASDDSKPASESENSSGYSRKISSQTENNVTVVNVSVDSDKDQKTASVEEESEMEGVTTTVTTSVTSTTTKSTTPASQTTVNATTVTAITSTTIPALPKPISARMERSKMAQVLHNETRSETHSGGSEKTEEKNSVGGVVIPVVEENSGSAVEVGVAEGEQEQEKDEQSHVTVIQVGAAAAVSSTGGVPGEAQSSLLSTWVDQTQQVTVGQRPEIKRLTVDKVPLRESRSLDDTREDSEFTSLVAREVQVTAEHEELLSMNHDLMRKLQAERAEITRLRDEIQEMQTLYGYRTYSYDSSESDGSESAGESDSEEDVSNQLCHVSKANTSLKDERQGLMRRIQEEREAVIQLRVKLRQWRCPPHHQTPISPAC
ncbi:hypothetical protein Pmani_010529 [Petrolisthes manimaculis]|uniref:Rho-GAP domain-containing protein n=1 Tax=Petrolisthes manimaculis TaxID=1843537 RepID=A0AAE1UFG3_9EUCA|nr:hypothetical protein Pmani_010529 [Petrolisthes manimaculis]